MSKLTYKYVKNFIEVESDSGCRLINAKLNNDFIKCDTLLKIQCKCGNYFEVIFSKFKTRNKRQCNQCAMIIIGNAIRLSYEYVKQFIEIESNSGCILMSQQYLGVHDDLDLLCRCGKPFTVAFKLFKYHNKRQCWRCSNKTNWDISNVREYFASLELTLFNDSYTNIHTVLFFKDNIGYYYSTTFASFLANNNSSHRFCRTNIFTILNIILWCKLNNKPFKLLSEYYEDAHTKLKWQCLIDGCGEIFDVDWAYVSSHHNCPYCLGARVGLSNCLATINPKLTQEWHSILNGNLTSYNVTSGSEIMIWWKCKKCGYEWQAYVYNRNKGSGCPACNESRGEKRIQKFLKENNIPFDPQYNKFEDLLSTKGNRLRFDFAIYEDKEKTKIKILCEFDGIQHTIWQKSWMSRQRFVAIQYHDRLKNDYCSKNNISLLRISYTDFDNMETILTEVLKL